MLNWSWNQKVGYMVCPDYPKCSVNLYESNALMCAITEWTEDGKEKYQLFAFYTDKDHLKRCLKNNWFTEDCVTEIHLNISCENNQQIVKELLKHYAKQPMPFKLVLE